MHGSKRNEHKSVCSPSMHGHEHKVHGTLPSARKHETRHAYGNIYILNAQRLHGVRNFSSHDHGPPPGMRHEREIAKERPRAPKMRCTRLLLALRRRHGCREGVNAAHIPTPWPWSASPMAAGTPLFSGACTSHATRARFPWHACQNVENAWKYYVNLKFGG